MNHLWQINLEDYLEIMEEAMKLGKERGKKTGDNLEVEFFEVAKKLNKIPKYLGQTEMDKDLIVGNLREEGLKVFNPEEIKKENQNDM